MSTGAAEGRFGPGSTVGVIGGGQLGRMLAAAAHRCGYRIAVLAPETTPPAALPGVRHVAAAYDDVAAVRSFAAEVDVLTFEFENVSSAALTAAAGQTVVRPAPTVLYITQDRGREKAFLERHGVPLAHYRLVEVGEGLEAAVHEVGCPCIVKTAGFGYDGKGQARVRSVDDHGGWGAARALAAAAPVVVERLVDLAMELSVVCARAATGEVVSYAPMVNRHVDQVLDLSYTPGVSDARGALAAPDPRTEPASTADEPARLPRTIADRAVELAERVVGDLGLVGVGCVEFFLSRSGELLVNEIAPRPHNSGHLTIEAAATDQFEQQLRAVCGLPLGSTRLLTPAAMANLLGDVWSRGVPDFAAALARPGVTLHLYGKREARPGRKMGHLTATAADASTAVATVLAARRALSR